MSSFQTKIIISPAVIGSAVSQPENKGRQRRMQQSPPWWDERSTRGERRNMEDLSLNEPEAQPEAAQQKTQEDGFGVCLLVIITAVRALRRTLLVIIPAVRASR